MVNQLLIHYYILLFQLKNYLQTISNCKIIDMSGKQIIINSIQELPSGVYVVIMKEYRTKLIIE